MKKTSLYLMALTVAAGSIFSSCKKEKNTPPVTQEKVCTLTKIYDANNKLQTEYVYENNKVSRINDYDSAGEIQSAMIVSYDASGNIAKVENTDSKGSVVSTNTYTYNTGSGTINHVDIKTSASDQDVTLNFEYNGKDPKKPSRVGFKINFMGAPIEAAYVEYDYDDKGNNTQAVTYVIDFSGSGQYQKQSTETFTYDDKKNPGTGLAAILLQPSLLGQNNVLKHTTTDNSNQETFQNNTYEYSAENYPVKKTSTDDQAKSTITTMEYTCK